MKKKKVNFPPKTLESLEKTTLKELLHALIANTHMDLHNNSTFSPKLSVGFDIICSFCTVAVVLIT